MGLLLAAGVLGCARLEKEPSASAPEMPAIARRAERRCALGAVGPDGANALERALRAAIQRARFDEVIDLGPTEEPTCGQGGSCRALGRPPHIDAAVIAFPPGCPPVFADAMLSPAFPEVRLARFEPGTLAVKGVRYGHWDQARWDAASDDGETFALPYPASNFKLMVAVAILALVDRGRIDLDSPVAHRGRTRAVRAWLEDMITWSDDESAEALIRDLHRLGEAGAVDSIFARLGLAMLELDGTSPETGRNWQPGRIQMSAWDTARLLWLLDPDAPAPSWTAPGGGAVDTGFLSPASRGVLIELMEQQALHDVLSTTGLCGKPLTTSGIPALLPRRWIADHEAGSLEPCNAGAAVTFAHKTGLTLNFGSDAGIVRGIAGRARRHYIVTFFSNLGYRYTDADKVVATSPCRELGICYTQRIAAMAAAVDAAIAAEVEDRKPRSGLPHRDRSD